MTNNEVATIVRRYGEYAIGYDAAINQLMRLGLTERQADDKLIPKKEGT